MGGVDEDALLHDLGQRVALGVVSAGVDAGLREPWPELAAERVERACRVLVPVPVAGGAVLQLVAAGGHGRAVAGLRDDEEELDDVVRVGPGASVGAGEVDGSTLRSLILMSLWIVMWNVGLAVVLAEVPAAVALAGAATEAPVSSRAAMNVRYVMRTPRWVWIFTKNTRQIETRSAAPGLQEPVGAILG